MPNVVTIIRQATTKAELTGLMYAPNGTIEISGSDHTLTSSTGVAWGKWVKMNGSLSGISASGGGATSASSLSE